MKKILFRKLLTDCIIFFLIALISTGTIIWIFQAVNFLDIIVEDGRDYMVYINYSLLNYPKIISKIIPFVLFFSITYVLTKYENNNELIIFWNFGVHKIDLINFFIKFSIIITLLQLLLTIYVVPKTQNIAKSIVRTSNVDFFGSLIKPKKFNANINGLTIYAEDKNEKEELKNIYLKKYDGSKNFQITIAKKGFFKTRESSKILVLFEGQTMNSVDGNITNFSFTKSDMVLSSMNTDVVMQEKIQEIKTINHINCIKKYYNKNLSPNEKQKKYLNHNCSIDVLDNLFQELYKRLIVPLYIPLLTLVSLSIIIISKENKFYQKYKIIILMGGIILIIISESFLNLIQSDFYQSIKIALIPLVVFTFLYFYIKSRLKSKILTT